MKTEFKVTNPDEVVLELTIKMTMKEWSDLKKQLSDEKYPSFRLIESINEMYWQAHKHFYPEEK